MPGDENDVLGKMNRDPPVIPGLEDLKALVRHRVGHAAYIHDMDYLKDGRVVAYLGVSKPRDTQAAALGDRELSFVNIAPVGAVVARPADGEYVVDVPDRDALSEASRRRQGHEGDHLLAILPALKNMLENRQEMHYDEAGEYGFHDIQDSLDELDLEDTEWFHLGIEVGMYKMAGLTHRVLMQRLRAAYRGRRRWQSPEYKVIRRRRTADPLEVL